MARVEGSTAMTSLVERTQELDTKFTPLQIKRFPKRVLGETSEEKHWKGFTNKTEIPSDYKGRVACIDFSMRAPYTCAATGQGKVMLYDPKSHEKVKDVHPPDTVYCTRWRTDGKMLASAGEKTSIKIWTNGSMKMVRELAGDLTGEKGHKRAVHSVSFLVDKQRLISGSDDGKAIIWDTATQDQLFQLKGHTDYVRTTAAHPFNKDIVATGSHDHTARVWHLESDERTPSYVFKVTDPVHCVVFHPSGGFLAAAAGTDVTIWDASKVSLDETVETETPVCLLSNHTKDITCIAYNNQGSRLFTASIDRNIKIYETETYTMVHSISLPQPVYSVAISPDGNCLAAGTVDGKLYFRSRPPKDEIDEEDGEQAEDDIKELKLYSGLGDLTRTFSRNWHKPTAGTKDQSEFTIEANHIQRLKRFDVAFRKFNYRKVMDETLNQKIGDFSRHMVFYTVMSELQRRNGLRIALAARDAAELYKILTYVMHGITDPRFSSLMTILMELILEIYHGVIHESRPCVLLLRGIKKKIHKQIKFLAQLQEVEGTMMSLSMQYKIAQRKRERTTE